jgi:hypothetical protein
VGRPICLPPNEVHVLARIVSQRVVYEK